MWSNDRHEYIVVRASGAGAASPTATSAPQGSTTAGATTNTPATTNAVQNMQPVISPSPTFPPGGAAGNRWLWPLVIGAVVLGVAYEYKEGKLFG
jgi:hypothetical protein